MYETSDDLTALQCLLDSSHTDAGDHLRSIFTDERRLSAEQLARTLTGVRVLALATVTATGEPRVAPVDGLFYRAQFYFGSSPDSVRFRHLRRRPSVSATYTLGEEAGVVAHGTATEIDTAATEHGAFRAYLLEAYGDGWNDWGADAAYARIDAHRMFCFAHDPSRY